MANENLDKYWLAHLEKINDEDSAQWFFINQIKEKNRGNFIDKDHDFFATPLFEEEEDEEENQKTKEKTNEGQLTLDVYQTPKHLIIKSTMAGVNIKSLDIIIENDILTIRGERYDDEETQAVEYFYQECFWGKFSRSIILPQKVNTQKVKAKMQNGLLTIILPKINSDSQQKIIIEEID